MPAGSPVAFTIVRVPRGGPRPSAEACREAIARDRACLHLPPPNGFTEFEVGGPYPVLVDGAELDEYTVWEK